MNEISKILHPSKKDSIQKQASEYFFSALENDLFRLGYFENHAFRDKEKEWKFKKNVDLTKKEIAPECFELREKEDDISFFETNDDIAVLCIKRQLFYNYPKCTTNSKYKKYTLKEAKKFCIPLKFNKLKFNEIISNDGFWENFFYNDFIPNVRFARDSYKRTQQCDDDCKTKHVATHCTLAYMNKNVQFLITNTKNLLSQSFDICFDVIT